MIRSVSSFSVFGCPPRSYALINAMMVSLLTNNDLVNALSSNGSDLRHRLQSVKSIFWLDSDRSGSLARQVFEPSFN